MYSSIIADLRNTQFALECAAKGDIRSNPKELIHLNSLAKQANKMIEWFEENQELYNEMSSRANDYFRNQHLKRNAYVNSLDLPDNVLGISIKGLIKAVRKLPYDLVSLKGAVTENNNCVTCELAVDTTSEIVPLVRILIEQDVLHHINIKMDILQSGKDHPIILDIPFEELFDNIENYLKKSSDVTGLTKCDAIDHYYRVLSKMLDYIREHQ